MQGKTEHPSSIYNGGFGLSYKTKIFPIAYGQSIKTFLITWCAKTEDHGFEPQNVLMWT